MESLRNEPVIFGGSPTGIGGGYGGLGGGLVEGLLLASLLGRGGLGGYNANGVGGTALATELGTLFNQQEIGSTRRDVKDSESEIRESLLNQQIANGAEFRSLDGKLCGIDKESMRGAFEAQISGLKSTYELSNKVDHKTDMIDNKINHLEVNVDKQFSSLKQELLIGLDKIREREQLREIENLRRQNDQLFSRATNEDLIKSMIGALKATGVIPVG